MLHMLNFKPESGILVSSMSTVWEETNGCANLYRWALDIYLMGVLSYLYGIIMDSEINPTGHGNNVVDGITSTEMFYLKEHM